MNEESKHKYLWAYDFATVYAGLGEKEQAFAYLEKEYTEGSYYLDLLKYGPGTGQPPWQ